MLLTVRDLHLDVCYQQRVSNSSSSPGLSPAPPAGSAPAVPRPAPKTLARSHSSLPRYHCSIPRYQGNVPLFR